MILIPTASPNTDLEGMDVLSENLVLAPYFCTVRQIGRELRTTICYSKVVGYGKGWVQFHSARLKPRSLNGDTR